MRMWMVKPDRLCKKHLLGEHVEIHMLVSSLQKGKNMQGFLENNLLEPQNIRERHDTLVKEMLSRGYTHNSPIPDDFSTNLIGEVKQYVSIYELFTRCPDCKKRILEKNGKLGDSSKLEEGQQKSLLDYFKEVKI